MGAADGEWSDLRMLLVLSRAGSMVAAAKQLGVEHTTVSRRIDALEKAIGTRLVGRARTGITLTDAGREAVRCAEEMERAQLTLARAMARIGQAPSGCVRVSMTDGLSPLVLPTLGKLNALHPEIEVQIQNTPIVVSIEKGEADIGLRAVAPTTPTLVSQRITNLGWSLFASGDYLARRGMPASPEALEGHDLVGYDPSLAGSPGARWLAEKERGGRVVARANTTTALVALLAAGMGIGIIPCFLAPTLTRITPEILATSVLFAVMHQEQRDVPRVRIVFDHLVEVLTQQRERFEGRVTCA